MDRDVPLRKIRLPALFNRIAFCATFLVASVPSLAAAGRQFSCDGFTGVIASLEVGQRVVLNESFGTYQITLTNDGSEIGTVFIEEIGACHIKLAPLGALEDIYVPSHAIRSVKVLHLPPDPVRVERMKRRMD